MKSFNERTVLVTGAANGIGKAIALMAAEYGANVVIADVAKEALDDAAAELRQVGKAVESCRCDIRDMGSIRVVDVLGEERGRETNIDALLHCVGGYRVAIECKLAEDDVGRCSRPQLRMGQDANYERDHCDGSYSVQQERNSRCSLTSVGIRYWDHVPVLFTWSAEEDHTTCPLRDTYQLARNVIAACVADSTEHADPVRGHAVLLYDARNPAFKKGGSGWRAFAQARGALRDPSRLRRCTWQAIASRIRGDPVVSWLGAALQAKYGL